MNSLHYTERGMHVREVLGQKENNYIVWIHGLGESGLCFEKISRHNLLNSWNHLIPDLPGYGKSFSPSQPHSIEDTASFLNKWISDKFTSPIVLAGHSLGGVIGLFMIEMAHELFAAFIDIDGNKSIDDCTYSSRAASVSEESFANVAFPELQREVYLAGTDDSLSSNGKQAIRGYYASMRFCDAKAFYRHAVDLVDLSRKELLADRFAKLSVPKIYIAGHPCGASARSLDLLEKSGQSPALVSPSGHWPFIDQPDTFASELRKFLSEID